MSRRSKVNLLHVVSQRRGRQHRRGHSISRRWVSSESQTSRRTDRTCSVLWSDKQYSPGAGDRRLLPLHEGITWKISVKKSRPNIRQGGRGAAVCCLPDGVDSRVAALVVFDELCNTKAKHLELPCGLSIWPSPYLPEPDAPKQL